MCLGTAGVQGSHEHEDWCLFLRGSERGEAWPAGVKGQWPGEGQQVPSGSHDSTLRRMCDRKERSPEFAWGNRGGDTPPEEGAWGQREERCRGKKHGCPSLRRCSTKEGLG